MRAGCSALLLVVLLAGCAGQSGRSAASSTTAAPADRLTVDVDPGDGTAPAHWTLTCGTEPGGDHPDAKAACEHLRSLADPFAALPSDIACTQIYGGPQTAHVTGRWNGQDVDVTLSRTDGCRVDQWNSLVPLVPAAT
jgi:hypothetical protein